MNVLILDDQLFDQEGNFDADLWGGRVQTLQTVCQVFVSDAMVAAMAAPGGAAVRLDPDFPACDLANPLAQTNLSIAEQVAWLVIRREIDLVVVDLQWLNLRLADGVAQEYGMQIIRSLYILRSRLSHIAQSRRIWGPMPPALVHTLRAKTLLDSIVFCVFANRLPPHEGESCGWADHWGRRVSEDCRSEKIWRVDKNNLSMLADRCKALESYEGCVS